MLRRRGVPARCVPPSSRRARRASRRSAPAAPRSPPSSGRRRRRSPAGPRRCAGGERHERGAAGDRLRTPSRSRFLHGCSALRRRVEFRVRPRLCSIRSPRSEGDRDQRIDQVEEGEEADVATPRGRGHVGAAAVPRDERRGHRRGVAERARQHHRGEAAGSRRWNIRPGSTGDVLVGGEHVGAEQRASARPGRRPSALAINAARSGAQHPLSRRSRRRRAPRGSARRCQPARPPRESWSMAGSPVAKTSCSAPDALEEREARRQPHRRGVQPTRPARRRRRGRRRRARRGRWRRRAASAGSRARARAPAGGNAPARAGRRPCGRHESVELHREPSSRRAPAAAASEPEVHSNSRTWS